MQVREECPAIDQTRFCGSPRVTGRRQAAINVLLLGASFSTGNLGVGALACGTITSVLSTFPAAQLYVLDYEKEPVTYSVRCEDRTVSVRLINIRFSKKLFLKNNIALLGMMALCVRLIPWRKFQRKILSINSCLKHVIDADLITSIAGGDSFSDIYGLSRLLYVTLPQLLVLALGRPLILLPQTIGPFQTALGRTIGRFILNRAEQIYTRDAESLEEVIRLLGRKPENAMQAYDMGFALQPLPPPTEVQAQLRSAREEGVLVGLNVSGLLYQGGYTGRNQFGLKSDYRNLVRQLIKALIEESSLRVLLVPHVFNESKGSEGDNRVCRELFEELASQSEGRLSTLQGRFDQHQIKWVIGQCNFFIGSRMHACIAALSQCVPAIGLAYSRKFAGVLDAIGGGARVVDLRQANIDEVLEAVGRAFGERETLRSELKARIPAIKESVLNLFEGIQNRAAESVAFGYGRD
jgi:colanic acid/amylovoran biosynthesis protein